MQRAPSGKLPDMADKDGDGPSLELPSLGFGRRRAKRPHATVDAAPVAPAPAEEPREQAPEPDAERQPTVAPAEPERPTTSLPPTPPSEPAAPREKREFRLPAISSMVAALITGAVTGALMVGLTGAGFRFCEVVQGAPTCGDPGLLLLLAIVIVVVLVGKALLAAWDLPDPGSTSLLAVGLLSVVALLFLVDALFNWWMIIVIPLLSMLCFALSHWVTTAFAEGDE